MYKASAINVKYNKMSSSMVDSVGYHILYSMRFEFTGISLQVSTFVIGVLSTDCAKALEMLMSYGMLMEMLMNWWIGKGTINNMFGGGNAGSTVG